MRSTPRCFASASAVFFAALSMACWSAVAEKLEPIELPIGYEHAKYAPTADILRHFAAFTLSFDSKDDDDGDGKEDLRRVPEWVAQHVKRLDANCVDTEDRPGTWMTDADLLRAGVAPNDASYAGSGFDRGHMAPKLLAARVSPAAEWNTHTVLNAVPQRGRFNQQIWKDLEAITGAWAQLYGEVWVIQGPVFDKGAKPAVIGDRGEQQIAVPDALYKIVVRAKTVAERAAAPEARRKEPEVLVFLYPQLGPRYYGSSKDYDHARFLTTLDEVEEVTRLTFFPKLDQAVRKRLRTTRAAALWPTERPADRPDLPIFLEGCRDRSDD